MPLDYTAIFAYVFGLILLYVVFRLFYVPLRYLAVVGYHAVIGVLILWAIRVVGGLVGFGLAINPVTVLVAGFLGLPGVVLLAVLTYALA